MNFDRLFAWALAIVIASAATGRIEELQAWIWRAQAKVLYESRTATWGSPVFWSENKTRETKTERRVHKNRSE